MKVSVTEPNKITYFCLERIYLNEKKLYFPQSNTLKNFKKPTFS